MDNYAAAQRAFDRELPPSSDLSPSDIQAGLEADFIVNIADSLKDEAESLNLAAYLAIEIEQNADIPRLIAADELNQALETLIALYNKALNAAAESHARLNLDSEISRLESEADDPPFDDDDHYGDY